MENQIAGKQDWFKKLPKEQQWDIIKSLLGYYLQMVTTKMSALASLSALSAAMVIVATLNKDLVSLDIGTAKIILSILLLLIPISLGIFFLDIERGAMGHRKQIEEYLGKVETNPSLLDYVTSYAPFVVTVIYFVIVAYLLYAI